jgi:hypothetical protein
MKNHNEIISLNETQSTLANSNNKFDKSFQKNKTTVRRNNMFMTKREFHAQPKTNKFEVSITPKSDSRNTMLPSLNSKS